MGNSNDKVFYHGAGIQVLTDGTDVVITPVDLSAAIPPLGDTEVRMLVQFRPASPADFVILNKNDSFPNPLTTVSASVAGVGVFATVITPSTLIAGAQTLAYANAAPACNTNLYVNGFSLYL